MWRYSTTFPARLYADIRRQHRWIRGDWQLLAMARPESPFDNWSHAPNPLTLLSRWKVFDNLRRSLVPTTLLLLLLVGLVWRAPGRGNRYSWSPFYVWQVPLNRVCLTYAGNVAARS